MRRKRKRRKRRNRRMKKMDHRGKSTDPKVDGKMTMTPFRRMKKRSKNKRKRPVSYLQISWRRQTANDHREVS